MKKKKFLFVALFIITLIAVSVVTVYASNTNSNTPTLTITSNTLELKNAVFMNFKVKSTDITDTSSIKLLVWEEVPTEYKKNTEEVCLDSVRTEQSTGYLVFQYDDLSAKEMTKFVYVCAYANVDGAEVYSKPVKFSIIQYAYNALISDSTDENLKELLTNMLAYGASSQIYFDYNTEFLATDSVAKIKVVNGTHADGFKTGYYKAGTSVTLLANAPEDGYLFSHWENSIGQLVGTETTLVISEGVSETYTAVYTDANSTAQYRYRDKQYTTSQTILEEPWVLYDTTITYTHSGYNYMYLRRTLGGTDYGYSYDDILLYKAENSEKYCFHGSPIEMYQYVRKYVSAGPEYIYLTYSETEDVDLTKYSFYQNCWALKYCTEKIEQKTYHYYQWSEWSDWNNTPVIATDDREVEVRGVFTVSYDANGGENAPTTQAKVMGESIAISTNIPTREGYTFKGWSSTIDGNVEYYAGDIYSTDNSITLYAVWEVNTYVITYHANGGENAPEAQIKTYGIDILLTTAVPTRAGYTFAGWATSANGMVAYTTGDTYTSNAQITLYAVWSINTYTITYNANGGENAPEAQTKTYGVDLILSNTVPTRDGYTFKGWATSVDGVVVYNTNDSCSINENLTLYAVWELNPTVKIIASGTCGENLTWTLSEDGFLYIVGSGAMEDYSTVKTKAPWYTYKSAIQTVIIGDNITSIGSYAFWNCTNISSVSIGNSVKQIKEGAFYSCQGLLNIIIPDSVTIIYSIAFSDCSNLKSITLGSSVKSIGNSAFSSCTNLENICLPNSMTYISATTFSNCTNLRSVTIPISIDTIYADAFYNCTNLTEVHIQDIEKWCSIDFYSYMSNPLFYAHNLFLNNTIVTELIIPESVTSISDYAFKFCHSLTSVTITKNVKSIGNHAFYGCVNLTDITFEETKGWQYYSDVYSDSSEGTINIYNDSSTLMYLTDTYSNYIWKRT